MQFYYVLLDATGKSRQDTSDKIITFKDYYYSSSNVRNAVIIKTIVVIDKFSMKMMEFLTVNKQ